MASGDLIQQILARMREFREKAGLSPAHLDERLILGPGWVSRFESGEVVPTIDVLFALLAELNVSPAKLFEGIEAGESLPAQMDRQLRAVSDGDDVVLHFRYANFDAAYRLQRASLAEFEAVLKVLRDGLARLGGDVNETAVKADSVAQAFLAAVGTWPHANPSDLWGFLVYRAYCDPYNHPAAFARMNFDQSWKRTSGWALEEVLVRFYRDHLSKHGIRISIETGARKSELLSQLEVKGQLEFDKVDVLLSGDVGAQERCFGVVHVKSSFAERRTDDVPMSQTLISAGYTSPLWTLDYKSIPSATPINRGELGATLKDGEDRRSAKRKDIEVYRYFSACFAYNTNTTPTPAAQKALARVYRCDFRAPDDDFSRFIISEWKAFKS
jgi:transcriptional regulator with XRE-family HTH domain